MVEALPADASVQSRYQVRFDWGQEGGAGVAQGADVIAVIDSISFTTTVEIAVSHGLEVIPYDGVGDRAELARRHDAIIGGPRGGEGITLSPSSITAETVVRAASRRVVLASLNGSRVSFAMAGHGVPVVAACLRNRSAVADWILDRQVSTGRRWRVAVVACGERRADGSLRFAVEDQLVAGSLIDALVSRGIDDISPDAAAACAAYATLENATAHLMSASTSAQQLVAAGQGRDVALATERDVSRTVPVLREFRYSA